MAGGRQWERSRGRIVRLPLATIYRRSTPSLLRSRTNHRTGARSFLTESARALDALFGAYSCRRTGVHPGSSPGQAFAGICAAQFTSVPHSTAAACFIMRSDEWRAVVHPAFLPNRNALQLTRRHAVRLELPPQAGERQPQPRLHGAERQARLRRDLAVGEALEEGKPHQVELLLRQQPQGGADARLALAEVERIVQ